MGRIMAIDYGGKRTGIAVTDPFRIIASGLQTVETKTLIPFLKQYFAAETVDHVIIGEPKNWDDSDTHATPLVQAFVTRFKKEFPQIPIEGVDERFTSKMAKQSMIASGMKKKDRRDKGMVDLIAATILLQEFLESQSR
ncbi:Holliday junction resolvase RuvX [Flavihumibacter petaseus]|uniref:Putative pre-16S rRNA nuclease n=1 Tax=Flavihumibacter petaseus NBRC 106054 TaxID=1220578 RepID=A0A0E9N1T8_9BACT|nr:Holliday junction resolvase RuvX [Flavihumibacter petaseus]GAO43596.1 putative Holliday junction resolvase [Flavihumibacter petaseus NBRC 106054]